MIRVFSGSCLNLEDQDIEQHRPIPRAHELGPGVEYFDENGLPVAPQSSATMLHKVFSGSALDLNDINPDDEPDATTPMKNQADELSRNTIKQLLHPDTGKDAERSNRMRTMVLVVGAGGYIGSHVVAALLEAGYQVRAGIPELAKTSVINDLYAMVPDATRRLFIVELSGTVVSAYKDALKNCRYVVHCGTPLVGIRNPQDLVEQHLQSARALFEGVRLYGRSSVRRIVLTGSSAAVFHPSDPIPPCGYFSEVNWNERATAETEPFHYAKVAMEKEAWRLHEVVGSVEFVVLVPSIVIGPSKTHEVSEAMRMLQDLGNGSRYFPFVPKMYWNFVDVRDVARAHLNALEVPEAAGNRYIVTNSCLAVSDVGRLMRASHPHLHAPIYNASSLMTLLVGPLFNARITVSFLWNNLDRQRKLDGRKAVKDLSLELRPMADTVRDAVTELISAGLLPSANAPGVRGLSRRLLLAPFALAIATAAVVIVVKRRH